MLVDPHARRFSYLRLSLTDACQFRCVYCLPHGFHKDTTERLLRRDELRRLLQGFTHLGIRKLRLTGGEPTVRADFAEVLDEVASLPALETIALSTNGHKLRRWVPPLLAARVSHVNVSVDSLDPQRFAELTGRDVFADVWDGVETAHAAGLKVKINAVWLNDTLHQDFDRFAQLVSERAFDVRFIELMPTADNKMWFEARRASAQVLVETLMARGFAELPREDHAGPARLFARPGDRGRIGVIAPYGAGFCNTCNRLRVTARGGLRLCLFGDGVVDLRPWLQRDSDRDALCARVLNALTDKAATHPLALGRFGDTKNFAQWGG